MILNQKGNATLIGLLFLMSISAWVVIFLQQERTMAQSLKTRLKTFICGKSLNGETKALVGRIELLNQAIMAANAAGLNPATAAAAKMAKKAAQLAQQGAHVWFYKRLFELHEDQCLFGPVVYLTPYKHKGLLSRDGLGLAQLRIKKWRQNTISSEVVLNTEFKRSGLDVEMETESYEIQAGSSLLKSL